MAKSNNQKLKMIYLMDKFLKDTDEDHGITIKQMIEYLSMNDIKAERKSLYSDIECLTDYGLDIESEKIGRDTYYKLLSRDFEMAELKLLVDAVQSSMFITTGKTNELIKKLEALTSRHQAVELQRQVHVINRVKNPNEKIYIFVDNIHQAIHDEDDVEFVYGVYNTKKELIAKHEEPYHVSPWALTWANDRYYLVGYDHKAGKEKNFRVDKIKKLDICPTKNGYVKMPDDFNIATYNNRAFGMFGGKDYDSVKLKVDNELAGVMIDQFGSDIKLIPVKNENAFTVNVDVVISQQFIGWLVGLGDKVEVVAPEHLRDTMKNTLKDILKKYK